MAFYTAKSVFRYSWAAAVWQSKTSIGKDDEVMRRKNDNEKIKIAICAHP
jgi:hypothetical protein